MHTISHRELLLRAATVIVREAQLIRGAHVLANGAWPDQYRDARSRHDEYCAIAAALREAADAPAASTAPGSGCLEHA